MRFSCVLHRRCRCRVQRFMSIITFIFNIVGTFVWRLEAAFSTLGAMYIRHADLLVVAAVPADGQLLRICRTPPGIAVCLCVSERSVLLT